MLQHIEQIDGIHAVACLSGKHQVAQDDGPKNRKSRNDVPTHLLYPVGLELALDEQVFKL